MLQVLLGPLGRLFSPRPSDADAPPSTLPAELPPIEQLDAAAVIGARRPLVSRQGQVVGFEFHIDETTLQRLRSRDDPSLAAACIASLLAAMRLCAGQGSIALAELPLVAADSIDAGALRPGMWLSLDGEAAGATSAAQRQRLRAAGARLGWRAGPPPPWAVAGERPDFLLHSAADGPPPPRSGDDDTPLVLLDLADVDALEHALQHGASLAACALGRSAARVVPRQLPPQARQLLQLLNRLVRDADTTEVVAAIKADVSISLQLLALLNSAGVSPGRPLASLEDAVLMLGRDALYHWVAALLVRLAPPRPVSAALQARALARARLLELLARAAGEAQPGGLYLLGLASALPPLLQTTMQAAIEPLQLPPAAVRALLDDAGPWQPYLALAQALETPDLVAAQPLARPFGGLEAVLALSARSWLPPQPGPG